MKKIFLSVGIKIINKYDKSLFSELKFGTAGRNGANGARIAEERHGDNRIEEGSRMVEKTIERGQQGIVQVGNISI